VAFQIYAVALANHHFLISKSRNKNYIMMIKHCVKVSKLCRRSASLPSVNDKGKIPGIVGNMLARLVV
jgi:hypothetical protein